MHRATVVVALAVAAVVWAAPTRAAGKAIETTHLVVSDDGAHLSKAELQRFADEAEAVLGRVLALWSADGGFERWGKIRVVAGPQRRAFSSCLFYWDEAGGKKVRTVGVYGTDGAPQMLAHKLTSAIFPQKDKLIRNMMGIVAEVRAGSPAAFPMCGFTSDAWVLALIETRAYLPLSELGPEHASWGMEEAGAGKMVLLDEARQHAAYAEAGSFAGYLVETHGIGTLKQLQRRSQQAERPFREVFGAGLEELEARWLAWVKAGRVSAEEVARAVKLIEKDPADACAAAQKLTGGKR